MESTVILFNHNVLQQTDILPMYIEILKEHGFIINEQKYIHTLTNEQLHTLDKFIDTSDPLALPICAIHVNRINAITTVKQLIDTHVLKHVYTSATQYNAFRDIQYYFSTVHSTVERTVLLLNPGYTTELYKQVTERLHSEKYIILGKQICILNKEQISLITTESTETQYLSSDVTVALLLEKINCINEINLLLGPNDPNEARSNNPHTLRALYGGVDTIHNILYTPPTTVLATKLIHSIFTEALPIERSIVVLKPNNNMIELQNQTQQLFKQYGITLITQQSLQLTKLRAEQYLAAQRIDTQQFNKLVQSWCSDALHVYLLEKVACIDTLHTVLDSTNTLIYTSIHDTVLHDINEFFPTVPAQHIATTDAIKTLLQQRATPNIATLSDVLVQGLTALCRIRPTGNDAILWLADWLDNNNPYKPKIHSDSGVAKENGVVTVSDDIADSTDISDKKVIFVTGAPYTNISAIGKQAINTTKYDVIDVVQVLKQLATEQNSQADTLHRYMSTHRCIPATLICTILQQYISKSTKSNVVLLNYPYSQDQAFIFDSTVVKPEHVIVIDSPLDSTILRSHGTDKNIVKQKYGQYRDEIILVGEHYQQFQKCSRIQYSTDNQVVEQIQAVLQ